MAPHAHDEPERAARLWLAVAVATLWLLSVGGEAEETIPASTVPNVTALIPEQPRMRRATRLRLVSVFRRGWNLILVALLPPHDVRSWPVWEPFQPHVAFVVDQADRAGLSEPTARLMNDLGLFLTTKCVFANAEPLFRRALTIDEAAYGVTHPSVAADVTKRTSNNLALLLQETNRAGGSRAAVSACPDDRRGGVWGNPSQGGDAPQQPGVAAARDQPPGGSRAAISADGVHLQALQRLDRPRASPLADSAGQL